MIKSFEELGDVLDDFDCRLFILEQSQLPANYSLYHQEADGGLESMPAEPQPSRALSPKEWTELQQVKSNLLFLQEKINRLEKAKVDKQPKYTIK